MKTDEIIIKERFKPLAGTKQLDTKNRLTLSGKVVQLFDKNRVNGFSIYVGREGDILLRPMSYVPTKSPWSKKALLAVKKGITEVKAGKTKNVKDLEEFFEQL